MGARAETPCFSHYHHRGEQVQGHHGCATALAVPHHSHAPLHNRYLGDLSKARCDGKCMGVCEEHMLVLEQLFSLEGSGELQRMLNAMQAQDWEPVVWQRVMRVPVSCRQAGGASTAMHEPPTAPPTPPPEAAPGLRNTGTCSSARQASPDTSVHWRRTRSTGELSLSVTGRSQHLPTACRCNQRDS